MRARPAIVSVLVLVACTEGSSGGGDGAGGAGGTTGAGAAASGEFPAAQWTVTLPGAPVLAAIDEQQFSAVASVAPGHLRYLGADGQPRFDEDEGVVGCLAKDDSGGTAIVVDGELQLRSGTDGSIGWTAPAAPPCQLAMHNDRVVLADSAGVHVFSSNGQTIAGPLAVAVDASSNARRMLDVEDVIAYGGAGVVGGLSRDGEPTFEWDFPGAQVGAVRAQGVTVVAALSFSGDLDLCGQTVSSPSNNTRAALVAFEPNGQCSWSYVLLNQGAAPQSTVIHDLAVAGSGSLWAAGTFDGQLAWGPELLDSSAGSSFLVELDLGSISPARATNQVAASAIDASSYNRVLVVSGSDVSLLY